MNAFYLIAFEQQNDLMIKLLSYGDSAISTMEMKSGVLAEKAVQRLKASSPQFPCYPLSIIDNIILVMPTSFIHLHPGIEYESTPLGILLKAFCEDSVDYAPPKIGMLRYLYGYNKNQLYSLLVNEEAINKSIQRWDKVNKKDRIVS